MENLEVEKFISAQKQQWSDATPGWVKWDAWLASNLPNVNQVLLERAGVEENQFVLDLGCGTGYPSLVAAPKVGKSGFVVALDLSESMVEAARKNAEAKGIRNVGFRVADVTKLLFADVAFDAIFSRFCLMFVPDPQKTLKEVFRVLKRGKSFAAAVWGPPEKNPMPGKIMKNYFDLPAPDPAVPGVYRFGKPGILSGMLQETGFSEVTEEEVGTTEFFGTGEEYADHVFSLSATMKPLIAGVSEEKRKEIFSKLAAAAEEYRKGDHIEISRVALIVSGKRPLK